jgi:hypothetical protein
MIAFRIFAGSLIENRPSDLEKKVLILGYPHALVQPVSTGGPRAARRIFEQPSILNPAGPGEIYKPDIHVLMTYPPAGKYDSRGFSGAGVWQFDFAPGEVFSPVPVFSGMIVAYRKAEQALIALKQSVVQGFLQRVREKFSSAAGLE